MIMEKQVEHEGTVASVCDNTVIVRIVAASACSGCAAHGHCMSGMSAGSKEIDIRIDNTSSDFVSGERVKVIMRQAFGMRALFIGYIAPLVLVLATLPIVYQLTHNELASGISALLMLVPYYLSLKLFNRKISKAFGFTVQKINVT